MMSGARLPTVRLPTVIAGQVVDEQDLGEGSVRVDLSHSSKFSLVWPSEPPPPVPLPLATDRPSGVSLSSSEGETDVSEEEPTRPVRRDTRTGESDDSEFVTPTNHMESDQNPLEQTEPLHSLPRLSRALSMPLPSQLGLLRNPRRVSSSPSEPSPTAIDLPPEYGHFHELSLELADSVQMVIQTLLQLSPPQVLDPAKEQFSACSLSIPTPSVSAMFTSMKNLNYMSANMLALSLDDIAQPATGRPSPSVVHSDFDIGEMLQSVGDSLSGMAAEAGVDLVLFHGDLGMKHIAVKGDESGISYTLCHVIRQIIGVAHPGDAIEIGLFIEGQIHADRSDKSDTLEAGSAGTASPTHHLDGPLRCAFHIVHRISPTARSERSDASYTEGDSVPESPSSPFFREQPSLKTLFLRRLLRHVGASLEDVPPRSLSPGRTCDLIAVLERGSPSVVDPLVNASSDDSAYQGFPEFKISHEPTLEQLIQFAESLKGRKVTLFANSKGSFAQHLTSYLTAWGLDVSHVSTEPDADLLPEHVERAAEPGSSPVAGREEESTPNASTSAPGPGIGSDALSFCLIDDDVAILRSRLQKIRAEQAYPLHLNTRKRPSLANNHRPRSSPQVARVMGLTSTSTTPFAPPPVLIHFTSLANFKLVKEVIQSVLIPGPGNSTRVPEVIVIPKPAGPRRVLTALHTAITKPIVDPFFYPTATSPISPGFPAITPFFNMSGVVKSPGGRSTTSIRTASDKSARSPKEYSPSSPRGMSDSIEYFSDAAARLGTSPASGLVIQSPDGQPAGIFFHPKAKGSRNERSIPQSERGVVQSDHPGRSRGVSFRRGSDHDGKTGSLAVGATDTTRRSPRASTVSGTESSADAQLVEGSKGGKDKQGTAQESANAPHAGESPVSAGVVSSPTGDTPTAGLSRSGSRRNAPENLSRRPSDSPSSPSRATPPATTRRPRRPNLDAPASAPPAMQKKGKTSDTNIVPPISVLIVDDNPINQTILSTFMTKKKIKYDVAINGEEAVMKWQTGGFHLILMDIQMPVMDGIEATKEIRRMEKQNAAGDFPSTPQSEGQRTPSEASASESRSSTSTPPYRSSVIIVALTASSLQSDRVAALAAGCNDFLTKPVSLHWLNSKIIEWGSIKALQMWADIRPEVVKSISSGQAVQAQNVARRLHVPEGRSTPTGSRSRSSSVNRKAADITRAVKSLQGEDKSATPNTPVHDDSPGASSNSSSDTPNARGGTVLAAVAEHVADTDGPGTLASASAAAGAEDALAAAESAAESTAAAPGSFFPSMPPPDLAQSGPNLAITPPGASERPTARAAAEDEDAAAEAEAEDAAAARAADDAAARSHGAPPAAPEPEPQ